MNDEGRTPLEPFGADPDEMGPLRHLDDRDLDRLIAGRGIDGDLEAGDLAGLVDDVRATHLRPVAQDTRARHLTAMAEAAHLTPSTDPLPSVRARRSLRSLMPRNRFAAIAAAIAATTVTVGLGSAGLAVAGVMTLPAPANAVLGSVGLGSDNQDTEANRAEQARESAVRDFIDDTPSDKRRGCAFGQQVAELARGEALPAEAKERCAAAEARRDEGEDKAVSAQNGEGAQERDSFGAETSERAKAQGDASAGERRDFGQETSELARERARDRGANAGGGGRTEGTPPAGVSPGRSDSADGPPAGRGSGPQSGAGAPERVGPPEGAGPPQGAGGP